MARLWRSAGAIRRSRITCRIEEALEQEAEPQRVQVGNCQGIGHQRARAGTTAGTDRNVVLLGPLDKVRDDQEITREPHLLDDVELEIEALAVFALRQRIGLSGGDPVGQTLMGPCDQFLSLVAALGAATLAIGLALQGTLSNLAAGVMIILFRPYKLGDFVEVAGQAGSVKDITLFTTELATGDNKKVIVPNGSAWGDVITNYSANDTRRVDFTFSIDYSDDIGKAMTIIQETLGADERVHKDPAVFTAVTAHGGSSVDIVTRVWCASGDYWGIYFDAMKNVKEAFDKGGISIPYPHQVNLNRED